MTEVLVKAQRTMSRPGWTLFTQLVAIVSFLLASIVGIHQVRYASCLARYNDAASAASTQRAQAASDSYAAIDKMIKAIANASSLAPAKQGQAIRDAFETYLSSRGAADEQRKLNPLPAPPSETCR